MAEDIKNTSVRSDQFRFWGILSLYMGIFMIPSGLLGLLELTSDSMAFLGTGFFAIAFGLFLSPKTKFSSDLKARDGFIMVTCGWLIGSVWAALPYWFAGVVDTPVDAIFEAISGLTTTGATIFNDVESLPKSILLWRSVTQWLGGMGIILIAVAILPTLGAGGSQLFAAEVPGLSVERLSPRIATTARLLWVVYAVLTVLEALLLWRFGYGMGLFDAINHALTTMATGGFSTKNASAGAFGPLDQWIMIIFIFAAGTNFTLHYRALTGQPIFYWKSEEFRVYLGMIIVVTSIVTALLFMEGDRTFEHALRASAFQVVSIITTTGYVSEDYEKWPMAITVIIFVLLFVGGSAGSTAGGIKQARLVCLWKSGVREIQRLLHPQGVFMIKINNKTLPLEVTTGVMGFFAFYIFSFVYGALLLALTGMDFESALGCSASSLGNVGPGLGSVGATDTYASLPPIAKLVSAFLMLIGRLELMTVFVVLAAFAGYIMNPPNKRKKAPVSQEDSSKSKNKGAKNSK